MVRLMPQTSSVPPCSAEILVDLSIPWVILGHSERRALVGESSEVPHAPQSIETPCPPISVHVCQHP